MYATASDVATNLGRSLSAAEEAQAAQWIGWAESTIQRRLGDLGALDPDTLNMVIVEAVSRRLRMPEPVTQVSVSVDDGNVNKTYSKATGLIDIQPEWWAALGWVDAPSMVTFRPLFDPDADVSPDAWR